MVRCGEARRHCAIQKLFIIQVPGAYPAPLKICCLPYLALPLSLNPPTHNFAYAPTASAFYCKSIASSVNWLCNDLLPQLFLGLPPNFGKAPQRPSSLCRFCLCRLVHHVRCGRSGLEKGSPDCVCLSQALNSPVLCCCFHRTALSIKRRVLVGSLPFNYARALGKYLQQSPRCILFVPSGLLFQPCRNISVQPASEWMLLSCSVNFASLLPLQTQRAICSRRMRVEDEQSLSSFHCHVAIASAMLPMGILQKAGSPRTSPGASCCWESIGSRTGSTTQYCCSHSYQTSSVNWALFQCTCYIDLKTCALLCVPLLISALH